MRGATRRSRLPCPLLRSISIRAPLAGSDDNLVSLCDLCHKFQSALPLRGATTLVDVLLEDRRISIRAPLAGSDFSQHRRLAQLGYFNPRSPCGERRERWIRCWPWSWYFNPRSPCGERRRHRVQQPVSLRFQSALPLRGATRGGCAATCTAGYFNPRSPCGERPLHFVASIYYQQSVVFSKTVAANSVDKLRKTTAKSAITRCEPRS